MKTVMNVENVLKLADLIESLPPEQFNIGRTVCPELDHIRSLNLCGTPSCVAGWATWLELGRPKTIYDNGDVWDRRTNSIVEPALKFLGITDDFDARYVFDELFRGAYCDGRESFTNAEVAQTLRQFAATGEVMYEGGYNDE